MSDENPPSAFNWNLGPKKPGDPANPTQPPVTGQPDADGAADLFGALGISGEPDVAAPTAETDPFAIFTPPTQSTPAVNPLPPSWNEQPQPEPPAQLPFVEPPVVRPPYIPPPAQPPYLPPLSPPPLSQPPYAPPPLYSPPPAAWQPPPTNVPVESPAPYVDVPTQAYSLNDLFDAPFDASLAGGGDTLAHQPVGLPEPPNEGGPSTPAPANAIDALFGESQFKEYEAGFLPTEIPFSLAATSGDGLRTRTERAPLQRSQKTLLWLAGGLVAALALVGLFFAGTKLHGLFAHPAPVAAPTPTPTSVAAPQPAKVGPVSPGLYRWSALLGGECVQPFTNAWAEQFTVVDCATPHAAQVVSRGVFVDESYAPYPGLDALQSRINVACSGTNAINYAAASQFNDIQISASYAPTAQDWLAGNRGYYCFVSRTSGSPLTASVATPAKAGVITAGLPGNDP